MIKRHAPGSGWSLPYADLMTCILSWLQLLALQREVAQVAASNPTADGGTDVVCVVRSDSVRGTGGQPAATASRAPTSDDVFIDIVDGGIRIDGTPRSTQDIKTLRGRHPIIRVACRNPDMRLFLDVLTEAADTCGSVAIAAYANEEPTP